MYYLLAIAALGFLIVVHEGGHYFVARWCQMRIERFSIGFGPGILKRTSKKTGTTFQLAPIPFGGFVEIQGMNIAEEVDPEDRHAYPNRPAWQRFVTIFAGPATNYLSAIVLAMLLYTFHGVDDPHRAQVSNLIEGYDAHDKLMPGDLILEVDHQRQFSDTGPSLPERINAANGAPITLTIERDGKRHDITITPSRDNKASVRARQHLTEIVALAPALAPTIEILSDRLPKPIWRIGVVQQPAVVRVGIVDAASKALLYPIKQTEMIGAGLYGIVFGDEEADPGGPKRIVEEFHHAFSAGIVPGVKLLMVLSVYLGLFNLFPLPALDGGRLVFLGYEMVTRRRANPKLEAMVHMAGIMVLGVVMILVTLHDFHVL